MSRHDNEPAPNFQTAIIQGYDTRRPQDVLSLVISHRVVVPALDSEHHVRVKVLAVALNPSDYKMVQFFPARNNMAGCDFCGVVTEKGAEAVVDVGTRVCGAVFPYGRQDATDDVRSGAFSQFATADSRLLLRVPETWSDLEGAALGGVGWCTVGLALSSLDALALSALPSKPADEKEPVLVYGAATATGTMACQLFELSGFAPVSVTSPQSSALAIEYGASGTASYLSPTCAESLERIAGTPIRHAFDCITSAESVATCFAALARTGGRYACVESLQDSWRTRRAVRVKEVMGYEAFGRHVQLGSEEADPTTYTRKANPAAFDICARWAVEMQKLLDASLVKHHLIREVYGLWEGIIDGVDELRAGGVRGEKLVVDMAVTQRALLTQPSGITP
ncbi:putative zinc binding dehydrogenase [Hypoxylon sp. FL0543]|nr:putative zinc binding dehydrogenase [Hypoxylon sp. FL0543]